MVCSRANFTFTFTLTFTFTVALYPLHAELNPVCALLVLLGAHHILHVSR